MKDNTDEINIGIIKDLRKFGVRRIAPIHCTGRRATDAMRETFDQDFVQVKEGSHINQ